MGRDGFTLAMLQIRVDGGCKHENLARAEQRIAEAAERGAELALLPEALTLGWTHPSAATEAEPIPTGESCERLAECARRHQMFVCAGLVERAGAKVFDSAVLLGPDGELLLHHRKVNTIEIEQQCYRVGDRLAVATTPLGRFGIMVCADGFAGGQVLSQSLALMGADVILSPCAWAVPADHDNVREPYGQLWRDNYGPPAHDFQIWIAGVSNVGWLREGPWAGRKCIGSSMLVGPDGQPVLIGPYGDEAEAILYAEIDYRRGRNSRDERSM